MIAAATRESLQSADLFKVAIAARLASRKRAQTLRTAVLVSLPERWRSSVGALLEPLDAAGLSLVLGVVRLMWRTGYRAGHADAVRGTHIQPGDLPVDPR